MLQALPIIQAGQADSFGSPKPHIDFKAVAAGKVEFASSPVPLLGRKINTFQLTSSSRKGQNCMQGKLSLMILLLSLAGGLGVVGNPANESATFVFVGRYDTSYFSYVNHGARMTYEIDEFEVVRPIRGRLSVSTVSVFPTDHSPNYPRGLRQGESCKLTLAPSSTTRAALRTAARHGFASVMIGPGELRISAPTGDR